VQKKILEFATVLRQSGMRVSVSETIDAFQALDELSFADRDVFRDALRSALVKRGDDIPSFDELFDLFWSGYYNNIKQSFDDAVGALGEEGIDVGELMRQLQEQLQGGEAGDFDLSDLAKALLTSDLETLEAMIRAAAEAAGAERIQNMLQIGFFTRRTMEQLGADAATGELQDLAARLRESGMGAEEAEALGKMAERFFEALRQSVRDYIERELQTRNFNYMEKYRREALFEKSFYSLTQDEIQRMREVVNRLAQRIKNVLSIRRRRLKRGKLDLHTILRRNMARGGVPFELVFKERRKDRPKLVILCDISSSVANVSRFMLQFMYSLQEAFTKIRAFVFVSELGEVTESFHDNDINRAIDTALDGGGAINVYTRSNFGMAFHIFWRDFLSSIDKRTTVLILGDARNNYNDPKAWCLRDIHNKAKNVVWLNPESPNAWGFGDSVMDRYQPHCDVAEECRNLRQLSKLVDQLIL
jgi:uncharacterized protein with von Willebrand factor type A (vWA) domain